MIRSIKLISKWKIFGSALGALTGQHIYDCYFDTKISLYYQGNKENQKILEQCPSLRGHFIPSLWSCCALVGLLYANLVEHQIVPVSIREFFNLKDGGQIALDWRVSDPKNIVIIAHGLTGGGDCNYIKDTLERFYQAGYTSVCVNQRGVAFSKLITPRYHNHGDPSDFMEVIEMVKKRYPGANLYGMGISIGSNMITKYAGLKGEDCPFKAIVSIANPFDLNICHDKLKHWTKYLYQFQITENFKWLLEKHRDIMYLCTETHGIDIEKAFQAKTPEEFDHHFTIKLFKYPSVKEMYKDNSCIWYMDNLKIPMLFINSRNDPICQSDHIPFERFYKQPNLILAITQKGGHIEWFSESNLLTVKRWIMDPTIEYLNIFRRANQKD